MYHADIADIADVIAQQTRLKRIGSHFVKKCSNLDNFKLSQW